MCVNLQVIRLGQIVRMNKLEYVPTLGKHSVTCAPDNVRSVPHRKKISASDSEINCRESQVPNVYSVCVASACPHELRSDRQPNPGMGKLFGRRATLKKMLQPRAAHSHYTVIVRTETNYFHKILSFCENSQCFIKFYKSSSFCKCRRAA